MANYVREDYLTRIPIEGGELLLSPGYDCVHLFKPLGICMLKYWSQDGSSMHNVVLTEENGAHLSVLAGLVVVERPFILASENDQIIGWEANRLKDSDFGL